MAQVSIVPYLFFSGRCEEAIAFYRTNIDAELITMMRFSESPVPLPPGVLMEGFEQKVMHATIQVGSATVLMSDGCNDQSRMDGFRLVLQVPDEVVAKQYFDSLADGGSIQMPLSKTFWSPCYGMVTDRFQVGWMVMVPGE